MSCYAPIVKKLRDELLWEVDDLNIAVENARQYNIPELEKYGVTTGRGFLDFANWLVQGWIPTETTKGRDIYYILCIFYFVLNQPPLDVRQTQIDPSCVSKKLSPLSRWVVEFAQHIGKRMDEPGSANEASLTGFRNAPTFRVFESDYTPPLCDAAGQGVRTECVEKQQQGVTNKEFENFNQFFCRQLKIPRPIAGENDHKTVVFPADSTFAGAYEITDDAEVDLKGLKWRVADLIQDEELAKKFKGGVWMHCFLNTFDYHRQHAPVSGKVKRAQVIKGAAYLEVVVKKDENTGDNFLDPCRRLDQKDKDAGSVHTVDAPDNPGYQFLQTRGIIVIENEKIGNVAVLPIGMAQVSSVKLHECGHYQLEGQELKKGEEISHFEFGGSDCVLLFEPKARVSNFPNSRSKTHFFYGEKLATSHYDKPVSSRDDFEENYIAVEKN